MATGQGGAAQSGNLNHIVIEYLAKRGYNRTEAMLRTESAFADQDGHVVPQRAEHAGGRKYRLAMDLLRGWIEENLDIYKPELRRLLWPIFVYSFLNLVAEHYAQDANGFFTQYKELFEQEHGDDLRKLSTISLPEHLHASQTAQIYRSNKYRVSLTSAPYFTLVSFLELREKAGGSIVLSLLQSNCNIHVVSRGAVDPHSLVGILQRATNQQDMPTEDEGIPGHNPGSANIDVGSTGALTNLKLGPLPMEPDLMIDVQAELEEEDMKNPPRPGQASLMDDFDRHIKREPSDDAPLRGDIPLPPSQARDVAMEVVRAKENRGRFRMEDRQGNGFPGVSVVMYTFHNTYHMVNCLDISDDNKLVAAGTSDSYIRVWTLDGSPLPSALPPGPHDSAATSTRRLIAHSGPVYAVSFSPSAGALDASPDSVATNPTYLLSSSADGTIRLWSVDAWSCLVVYKGHDEPVWDLQWGPFGHYFVSGGRDKVARLWSTDHIGYLRMFVGHDQDVDTVCFHPNSCYVFTGSNDKTVRMWAISNGNAVRIFTGHTTNITAMACSRDGKILASADQGGAIFLWDLVSGRRIKRMRGHGKGGIWSLSWNVESTVLVSSGADQTVRLWDVHLNNEVPAGSAAQQSRTIAGGDGAVGGTSTVPRLEGVNGGSTGLPNSTTGAASNSRSSSSTEVGTANQFSSLLGGTPNGGSSSAGGAPGVGVGVGVGVSGAVAPKKKKEGVVTSDHLNCFLTKRTPVYYVRFTRMNLVIAAGAFMVE